MHANRVVDVDGLGDGVLGRAKRREHGVEIKFVLQNAVDAFGDRVLVAVRGIRHTGQHVQGGELLPVGVAAVLAATIGVMDDPGAPAERVLRHIQSAQGGVMREVATQLPAEDQARGQIRDEKQVGKAAAVEREIGDVAHHDLAGTGDRHRLHAIRRHGVRMVRIRRLGRAPLARHEAPRRAQEREKMIAPHAHLSRGQGGVQLSRPDTRLDLPQGIDLGQHYGVRVVGRGGAALAFVVGVARAPEDAADGADGERVLAPADGVGRGVPKFFLMSVLKRLLACVISSS